eukprot:2693495-Ditylum_brightwellii.AAC.1
MDGSTNDNIMSFMWKICDSQGKTLFYHAGPVFGKESLFRAEAYDILLAMCFLRRWMSAINNCEYHEGTYMTAD